MMNLLVAFALGFLVSTVITFHEYSFIEGYIAQELKLMKGICHD